MKNRVVVIAAGSPERPASKTQVEPVRDFFLSMLPPDVGLFVHDGCMSVQVVELSLMEAIRSEPA